MSHELAAAYALGALDPVEREEFEEHLRRCEACREEIETLQAAAASLAFATELPPAPEGLRDRIVEAAVAERPVVVPFRRRMVIPAIAAAGVAATAALAIWAATLSGDLGRERSARSADARALAILAAPDSRAVSVAGADGQLVVAPSGAAALVVRNLPEAPSGKAYEIWVIDASGPAPAGLFDGGPSSVVALSRPVPAGTRVAVTLERAKGADAPTGELLLRTASV